MGNPEEEMRERLKKELRTEIIRELRLGYFQEEDEEERTEKDYPWIVFSLDGTEYGVNSKYVLSIEILGDITPIVDSELHCPGITRSRGNMIGLLDLRALFGLGTYVSAKSTGQDDRYMMVVVETGGVRRGLIVDQIVAVEHVTRIDSADESVCGNAITSRYIKHVARREKSDSPLLIINPENLNI